MSNILYKFKRYNENKPVTTSRDTQEIPENLGYEMVKMIRDYPYESSILDDFAYYEKKQIDLIDYKNVSIPNQHPNFNIQPRQNLNNNIQQQQSHVQQTTKPKITIIQNPLHQKTYQQNQNLKTQIPNLSDQEIISINESKVVPINQNMNYHNYLLENQHNSNHNSNFYMKLNTQLNPYLQQLNHNNNVNQINSNHIINNKPKFMQQEIRNISNKTEALDSIGILQNDFGNDHEEK